MQTACVELSEQVYAQVAGEDLEADKCDRTWEHSTALSEGLSNGAEAQDDMQVGAHTLQEVGI